jgi:hypothetical protein
MDVLANAKVVAQAGGKSLSTADYDEGFQLLDLGSAELKSISSTVTFQGAYRQLAQKEFLSGPGSAVAFSVIDLAYDLGSGNGLTKENLQAILAGAGAAVGVVCMAAAPACSAIFSIAAATLGGALYDWINGTQKKIARAKKNCVQAVRDRDTAWADALVAVRSQFLSRIGTYMTNEQATSLLIMAMSERALRIPEIEDYCNPAATRYDETCDVYEHGTSNVSQWTNNYKTCTSLMPEFLAYVLGILKNMEFDQAKTLLEERKKKTSDLYESLRSKGSSSVEAARIAKQTVAEYQTRRTFLISEYQVPYEYADSLAKAGDQATQEFIEREEGRRFRNRALLIGGGLLVAGAAGYMAYMKQKTGKFPSVPYVSVRTGTTWHAPRIEHT